MGEQASRIVTCGGQNENCQLIESTREKDTPGWMGRHSRSFIEKRDRFEVDFL